MDEKLFGITCALASAASWAVGVIIYKKIGEHLSASSLNLSKSILSFFLLFAALLLIGIETIDKRSFLLLAASGILGISLGDSFFFKSLQYIGAHLLIVLTLLGQVLTIFLAVIFLGESPSGKEWIGIALTLFGVTITLYLKPSGNGQNPGLHKGIFYGLLAVLCMSIGVIITKVGIASTSAIEATTIRMSWGIIGLFVWGLFTGRLGTLLSPLKNPALVKKILLAVIVATLGGFWLSHVAIKHIDVTIANTLNSTEPIFVMPLALIFLKEKITFRGAIGTLIAVCGIIFISIG